MARGCGANASPAQGEVEVLGSSLLSFPTLGTRPRPLCLGLLICKMDVIIISIFRVVWKTHCDDDCEKGFVKCLGLLELLQFFSFLFPPQSTL